MLKSAIKYALLPVFAVVALAIACGGDGGDSAFVGGEPIDCGELRDSSYTYQFSIVFDFQDSGLGGEAASGPGTFRFEQTFDGEVADSNSMRVSGQNTDGGNVGIVRFVIDDGRVWGFSETSGWSESELDNPADLALIPYPPFDVCEALVPDVDTTVEGSAEDVNGIRSERLDLGTLTSDFFDRIPSIGPGHDAATLIPELDISVWIAHDGRYTSKMIATGTGTYADGDTITVTLEFEVTEHDADVNIVPPI